MENSNLPYQTNYQKISKDSSCLNGFIFLAVITWMIIFSFIRHIVVYFSTINPTPAIRTTAFYSATTQLIFIGIPLLLLAFLYPTRNFRIAFQSLLLAWGTIISFLPGLLLDPSSAQMITLLHIIFALIYILFLQFITGRNRPISTLNERSYTQPELVFNLEKNRWLILLPLSVLLFIPWLIYGSLGSVSDTILQIIFAFELGIISLIIINNYLSQIDSQKNPSTFFLNSLVFEGVLLIVSSAICYGYSGIQLILLLILPTSGWLIAAIEYLGIIKTSRKSQEQFSKFRIKNNLPIIIFLGALFLAPLALVDPDELVLVLSATEGEILSSTYKAVGMSLFGIIVLSTILVILSFFFKTTKTARIFSEKLTTFSLATISIFSIGLAIFAYTLNGRPGFYGEYIFIILKQQASFEDLPTDVTYKQRKEYVYNTLVKNAEISQQNIRSVFELLKIPYTPYYLVNAIEAPDNPIIRIWLTINPDVDRILPSPHLRPLINELPTEEGSLTKPYESDWNISLIEADRVWEEFGVRGEGIIIGQSDSGVQGDHPELKDSYRGKTMGDDYNWYDPWNYSTSPVDKGGHGTHTLGSIVGENVGLAPEASWYACVNLARNLGNPARYLDCMQFMLAPFPENSDPFTDGAPLLGADIINNSWGCPEIEGCDALVFLPAVKALRAAGVFVVASAGNDGPKCGTLNYPLPIYDEVFSVGAIDRLGNLADFSSIGPVSSDGSQRIKPDIVAPGVDIVSSTPGNTYEAYSGTSMAGPHIAGVVALIWSANPSLIGEIDLTEEIIINTATPYNGYLPVCPGVDQVPSTAYGFGIVNAYEAVKTALEYQE